MTRRALMIPPARFAASLRLIGPLLIVALGGCASTSSTVPAPTAPAAPSSAFDVVGPAPAPADTDLVAIMLSVASNPEITFRPWDPSDTRRVRLARGGSGGLVDEAGWTETWSILGNGEGGGGDGGNVQSEDHFRLDTAGIVLLENRDAGERVVTVFVPAMAVAPRGLSPGESRTQELQMSVHPAAKPGETKAKGKAEHTVTFVGFESVRILEQAEPIVAAHVRARLSADLGAAKVRNTTDQWFAPGVGLVAQRRSEQTSVLGVALRSIDEAWVIDEPARGSADP
ncbi:MAG: hypothetical protein KF745_06670 [Phycisphaeraceae bacterium]|nr:hypothetical protein [Phycisphaeraceae bacterium]